MRSIQKLLTVSLSMMLCSSFSSAYFFDSLMSSMERPSSQAIPPIPQKKKQVKKRKIKVLVLSPEMKIQKSLHELGFYYGRINGLLSHPRTLMAIKEMNREYRRKKGENLDQEAQESLITLHDLGQLKKQITRISKSRKSQNKQTQIALKHLGYYKAKIDGSMGKKTRKAIRKYLKSEGLNAPLSVKESTQLIQKVKGMIEKEIAQILSVLKSESMPIQGFYVPSPEVLKVDKKISDKNSVQLIGDG